MMRRLRSGGRRKAPAIRISAWVLGKYFKLVGTASKGAVTEGLCRPGVHFRMLNKRARIEVRFQIALSSAEPDAVSFSAFATLITAYAMRSSISYSRDRDSGVCRLSSKSGLGTPSVGQFRASGRAAK